MGLRGWLTGMVANWVCKDWLKTVYTLAVPSGAAKLSNERGLTEGLLWRGPVTSVEISPENPTMGASGKTPKINESSSFLTFS